MAKRRASIPRPRRRVKPKLRSVTITPVLGGFAVEKRFYPDLAAATWAARVAMQARLGLDHPKGGE